MHPRLNSVIATGVKEPDNNTELTMDSVRSNDGTSIAFRQSGSGPPLVLIHGGTADHTRWDPVLPELEKRFTVYAVDRRGRGKSIDTGEYAIEREFEDIAAVIDAIDSPVNLLGHSFGAFCSLEAALLTGNINKLILYEPPPSGLRGMIPGDVASRMQTLLDEGDRDGVVSVFMLSIAKIPPGELELLRSLPAWQGRLAAAHTILREIRGLEELPPFNPERFSNMKTRTLLLLGGDSPPPYRDFIRSLDATLQNSTLLVMPGQKHVAMNTAPEMFVSAVTTFLSEEDESH
jgi:pimeloyl-ACP methyl ester carboxylesterase